MNRRVRSVAVAVMLLLVGLCDLRAEPAALPVDVASFETHYNGLEEQKLQLAVGHFQRLVEWALLLRSNTITFADELRAKKSRGEVVAAADFDILNHGIKDHLVLRGEIFKIVNSFKELSLSAAERPLLNERVRMKGTLLSLAGALVLYDNFALSIMAFQNDITLRRMVNRENRGFGIAAGTLKEILLSYHSSDNRTKVRDALTWIAERRAAVNAAKREDAQIAYLTLLINQSPSAQRIRKDNRLFEYVKYMGLFAHRSIDRLFDLKDDSVNEISKVFGNTVGLVQFRHGKLYGDAETVAALQRSLKPLDILLDQTPFRLTAQFIPGYFGHVAIWTGSPQEIKALGLWDHPLIKPRQKEIAAGKRIIEALRDDVQLNSLDHFLDVDDVAVLRLRRGAGFDASATLLRAFRQLGKEYDFNFDVETQDKIVCSELAYMVFADVEWPTDEVLGRVTISPDNVAVTALAGGAFDLVAFYRDGRELGAARLSEYTKLLQSAAK